MDRIMDASMIEWTRGAATTRKLDLDGTGEAPRKLNLGGTVEALVRKRGVNRSAFGRCACGLSVERAELLCDALRIFRNQIPFDDVQPCRRPLRAPTTRMLRAGRRLTVKVVSRSEAPMGREDRVGWVMTHHSRPHG